MKDVGLGYLNLDRRADTLSGGESQRIKIASELAKAPAWKLAEDDKRALFILDEPTGGLHFNEVELLLKALFRLRDAGHTVLCVEHHRDLLNAADHLIDMGPAPEGTAETSSRKERPPPWRPFRRHPHPAG